MSLKERARKVAAEIAKSTGYYGSALLTAPIEAFAREIPAMLPEWKAPKE